MTKIKNFLTPQWLKEFEEMKRQASSSKPQAASRKRLQPKVASDKPQASSIKHQAIRKKILSLQATSNKRLDS